MLRSALSVFLFCLLGRLDCKDLTAKRGENATLECFGSKDATEVMIEWRKSDSHSGISVIKFRDGNFTEHAQHDLFKGRVMPKDPNWKETEDFSVILMYVIMNNTGTYKCKAGYGEENDIKVLNTTNLTVESNITNITAVSGKNQILQCQNPNNDLIITVRWSRADQEPKHVVLYQKREFDLKEQHPSFKDRVDLQNRQMKDGDVSLILKGVTDADAGTYESRVIWKGTNHMKRADLETDPICIINLSVAPGQIREPEKDGSVGLTVGLPVAAVLLFVVVVVSVYLHRKCRQHRHDREGERRGEPRHERLHLTQFD